MSGAPTHRPRRGLRVGLVLAGALLALLALLGAVAERIVARGFERVVGPLVGSPVQVGSADIGWLGRSVALHDVEIASPAPGATRPFARFGVVRGSLGDAGALWRDGVLDLASAAVEAGEITIDARDQNASSLALLQRRSRWPDPGAALAAGIRRVAVADVELGAIVLRVEGASSDASAELAIGGGRVAPLQLPLDIEGGAWSPEVALLEATLRLGGEPPGAALSAAHVHAAVDVAATPAGLALTARALEASDVTFESVMEGGRAVRFDLAERLWSDVTRGLDLSAIASIAVTHGRAERLTTTQRRPDGTVLFRLTDGTLEVTDVRLPEPTPPAATLRLRGHPFSDAASLDLQARGALLEAEGRGPVDMTVRFTDLPLAPFPDLHLAAGRTSGSAEMRLAGGVVGGEATFRLLDVRAAADAPPAMRAAYASYATVAGSTPPEITVPLSFRLAEPDLGAVFREVAAALARRLGGSVVEAAERSLRGAGQAAADAVSETGRSARDAATSAGSRLKQTLEQLVR